MQPGQMMQAGKVSDADDGAVRMFQMLWGGLVYSSLLSRWEFSGTGSSSLLRTQGFPGNLVLACTVAYSPGRM